MVAPDPLLAPTLAGLDAQPRGGIERLASMGFRAAQLSASQLRPRDLDRSARRELKVLFRRYELTVAGLDLWIPDAHLLDSSRVDRAVGAMLDAIGLAGELGRCPLSLVLPGDDAPESVMATVIEQAIRQGVPLADHTVPANRRHDVGVGIDPASWLARGRDPIEAINDAGDRLVVARWCDLATSGMRVPGGHEDGQLDGLNYRITLTAAGYRGPIVIDTRGWTDPAAMLLPAAGTWAAVGPPGTGGAAMKT